MRSAIILSPISKHLSEHVRNELTELHMCLHEALANSGYDTTHTRIPENVQDILRLHDAELVIALPVLHGDVPAMLDIAMKKGKQILYVIIDDSEHPRWSEHEKCLLARDAEPIFIVGRTPRAAKEQLQELLLRNSRTENPQPIIH